MSPRLETRMRDRSTLYRLSSLSSVQTLPTRAMRNPVRTALLAESEWFHRASTLNRKTSCLMSATAHSDGRV